MIEEIVSFKHFSSGFYLMRIDNGAHAAYEGNSSAAGITNCWHREHYRAEFEGGTVEIAEGDEVKVYKVGEAQTFDGVTFTVTGTSFEYVKTNDSAQGEGFSSDPLLKVSYEVTNGSDATIKLDPGHKAVGIRGAALYGSDSAYNRVKFAATTRVEGQVDGSASIDPGQTVKDFILFEAPPKDVSELSFEYPAALFERTGLARFDVPFEWKEVPRPKELEKK